MELVPMYCQHCGKPLAAIDVPIKSLPQKLDGLWERISTAFRRHTGPHIFLSHKETRDIFDGLLELQAGLASTDYRVDRNQTSIDVLNAGDRTRS